MSGMRKRKNRDKNDYQDRLGGGGKNALQPV